MKRYKLFLLLAILLPITSCSDFLDREPDQLLSDEAVFNDPKMIKSALANIYGRARWGQKLEDSKSFIYLDEACLSKVDLTKPMNLQMIYGVSILTL